MDESIKQNLQARDTWKRILFMLLFGLIYSFAELVIFAVVLFQIGSILITGQKNAKLLKFGQSLSLYAYQILQYFTFNRDQRPYPFDDWPDQDDRQTIESTPDN